MVVVVPEPTDSMHNALQATRSALHHYAAACEAIQQLPQPSVASRLLELNIRRLKAIEADLRISRSARSTPDALYTRLNVLHAGLLSLADATGRLRHAYKEALPISPPAEGWFTDEAAVEGTTDQMSTAAEEAAED